VSFALQEFADAIVQLYSKAADLDSDAAVPFSYQSSVRCHAPCVMRMVANLHNTGVDSWMGCPIQSGGMWMLQGVMSDGMPLLSAVGPEASASAKAGAVWAMAAGLEATEQTFDMAAMTQGDGGLAWRASNSMAYMVQTSFGLDTRMWNMRTRLQLPSCRRQDCTAFVADSGASLATGGTGCSL
jgi:hypothetical protein